MREWQVSHFKAVVRHASDSVPFYRDRFRESGIVADEIKSPSMYRPNDRVALIPFAIIDRRYQGASVDQIACQGLLLTGASIG